MKRSTFVTCVAVCGILLAAGSALAKPGDRGMRMNFDEIDTNGDGEVTRAEMEALRDARFASADANGDGALSLEELTRQATQRAEQGAQKMMERLDANKDGVLSKDEMPHESRAGRIFDRVDRNDDGVITQAEFDTARERAAKRHGKLGGSE